MKNLVAIVIVICIWSTLCSCMKYTCCNPVACRGGGGERGAGPGHPRQGASKEWNYKNL